MLKYKMKLIDIINFYIARPVKRFLKIIGNTGNIWVRPWSCNFISIWLPLQNRDTMENADID